MSLQHHLRGTLLAGSFAAIPIVVTITLIGWIDGQTQVLVRPIFHRYVPLLGIIVAVVAIYLIGLVVRSLLGKAILRLIDSLLTRMPVVKPVYEAWKQVSLTPEGKAGMYDHVVLVPVETGNALMLGFTSGDPLPGRPDLLPIFLPNCPNPLGGRLVFVPRKDVTFLDCTAEEAMKLIVSTGNYLPPTLCQVSPASSATLPT